MTCYQKRVTLTHVPGSTISESAEKHHKNAQLCTDENGEPCGGLEGHRAISSEVAKLRTDRKKSISLPLVTQMGGVLGMEKGNHRNRGILCRQS